MSQAQVRSWWWSAAGTAAVVGWVAALVTTPPSALLASAVVFAAFSLLFTTGVQTSQHNRGPAAGAGSSDWRRLVDHTLLGTLGAIAALGLLQVSVTLTFFLAVALGASGTWAFSWHRSASGPQAAAGASVGPAAGSGEERLAAPSSGLTSGATGGPTGAPTGDLTVAPSPDLTPDLTPEHVSDPGPTTPTPGVGAMTTDELVLAWRRSYAELTRVRSPQQVAALAARRQQLLDELDRRDAAGVERWLRSGARAASDPSRFLQRPTGPSASP